MVLRESLNPDTSLWHWMAVDLHFYRVKHGLSCAQLGPAAQGQQQAVSNMEAARPGFRLDETKAKIVDELWELNGHFQRLLRYARAGHDVEWFQAAHRVRERCAHDQDMGGLIHSGSPPDSGVRSRLVVAGQIVEDVEAALTIRMERPADPQQVASPVCCGVLLGESALEWAVGAQRSCGAIGLPAGRHRASWDKRFEWSRSMRERIRDSMAASRSSEGGRKPPSWSTRGRQD
jgi:hypothetical protein